MTACSFVFSVVVYDGNSPSGRRAQRRSSGLCVRGLPQQGEAVGAALGGAHSLCVRSPQPLSAEPPTAFVHCAPRQRGIAGEGAAKPAAGARPGSWVSCVEPVLLTAARCLCPPQGNCHVRWPSASDKVKGKMVQTLSVIVWCRVFNCKVHECAIVPLSESLISPSICPCIRPSVRPSISPSVPPPSRPSAPQSFRPFPIPKPSPQRRGSASSLSQPSHSSCRPSVRLRPPAP